MYFVVKVTSGQERIAANMLQNKAGKTDLPIYSLIVVEGMRGYIIVEAEDELSCRSFISKERNIRGMLSKPLSPEVGRAIIETNKGISTVLAKSGPVSGVYRKRKLRHIYGAETYTATYRENGCTFVFDARKAFFSGRLSFERGRVDRLAGNGERVAVAGAGVGPFAIEIAKHHPMSSVLAIELNRSAYVYMKRNIKLNKTGNVEPVQGDFRSVANARKGYADRVIVPMPTVSIDMLPSVFMIAKPAATVHLYAFCRSDGVDALKERIKLTAHEHGRSARFIGRREVRPYSRDEIEVVLDIRLGMRRRRASAQ